MVTGLARHREPAKKVPDNRHTIWIEKWLANWPVIPNRLANLAQLMRVAKLELR